MRRRTTEPPPQRADVEREGDEGTTVQSVVVAVRILEALAAAGTPARVTELARTLSESKARVHRHLATLRSLGLVDQDLATERYRPGWKLFQLGQAATEQFDLKRLAEPYMARLRDLTRQTVILAVPVNGDPLVVACMESNNNVNITVRPGNRPPAHCSAQGRLVLAFATAEVQRQLLGRRLQSLTPRSLTDPEEIAARLPAIRARLYEVAADEVMLGVNTLAVPILDPALRLVGTLALVGSVQFVADPPAPEQLGQVHACAAAISERLNCDVYAKRGIVPMVLKSGV